MTTTDHDRAVSDPNGFITDLVVTVDDRLAPEQVRASVTAITGGRAKSRRLAAFLADRAAVLSDGRSPAPRAVGDLLIALRAAGAAVSPPVCAECSKPMRTLQRRGQDWYCGACGVRPFPCAACGQLRHISTRDRGGQPRCAQCPDRDDRDPISVIHDVIAGLWIRPSTETSSPARSAGSRPVPHIKEESAGHWKLSPNYSPALGISHPSARSSR